MNNPSVSKKPSEVAAPEVAGTALPQPIPILRVPMLDREGQLFAYEIVFHGESGENENLLQWVLSTVTDGALSRLVRGNRAFLKLPAELLPENSDVLLHQPRLGLLLQPHIADDAPLMERLQKMAQRGCQFMLEAMDLDLESSLPLKTLLEMVQFVRLDASLLSPETLEARTRHLHARGVHVIIDQVNDHACYERCIALPVQAVQGRYLLMPQPIAVPVLTANRLSMLRLMTAMQENNPGPVEIGNIIRTDAVLSFKLLSCVNSAYFALPRQLKSVEQAAVFFGVNRMRNWIDTMALCGMDDRPPELLRAALIRAQMCEKLAPKGSTDMAFTIGLLSLLDTLMCAPMDFLLTHLRLAPDISDALTERRGPFGPLLQQVLDWEAGKLTSAQVSPQHIKWMAAVYLEATQWADQVFATANGK
ncbi:MAG: HDOD domain-containing protein [Rhodanobacter sp.]